MTEKHSATVDERHVVYAALNEEQFCALVSGRIATIHGQSETVRPVVLKLILSDVGFARMKLAIREAEGRGAQ